MKHDHGKKKIVIIYEINSSTKFCEFPVFQESFPWIKLNPKSFQE